MRQLSLHFESLDHPELVEIAFTHPLLPKAQHVVRGKSSGAFEGVGSFQWTSAVRAFALLMVTTALEQRRNPTATTCAVLKGYTGSLAASLDYAISKAPAWILDTFGVDKTGRSVARRLFKRTNPERKRPGPVAVALNGNFLSSGEVEITVLGRPVRELEVLERLAAQLVETPAAVEQEAQVKAA